MHIGFRWATVTGTSPLRIQMDGDTSPLPFEPDSLIDPLTLTPGERVRCEWSGQRLIVHGRAGGSTVPALTVTRSSDQTLSTTLQAISFTSAPTMRGISWSSGAPTKLTAQFPGIYLISGTGIQINTTSTVDFQIRKNGGSSHPPFDATVAGSSGAAVVSFERAIRLAATDYLEVWAKTDGAYPWIAANLIEIDLIGWR